MEVVLGSFGDVIGKALFKPDSFEVLGLRTSFTQAQGEKKRRPRSERKIDDMSMSTVNGGGP
jgi:hypothetical protein